MITSQQPSSAALPAKQRPEAIPTRGTSPLSRANSRNVGTTRWKSSELSVSPGRPPPPSANSTTGSRAALGELDHPVGLAVVADALRAGEDGVVVGETAHGALGAEQLPFDRCRSR